MAADRRAREQVVAVVGDGAFNCGISLEGLNNVDQLRGLIVVLNETKCRLHRMPGRLRATSTA